MDSSFLLALERRATSFWSTWLLMRNLLFLYSVSPIDNAFFLFLLWRAFSLSLDFWSLMMCPFMGFFGLTLFGICLASVSLWPDLKAVSHYLFQYFFSHALFLLSIQDNNDMNIRYFVRVPQVLEASFYLLVCLVYFLCCFRLGNCYYSINRLTESFLFLLHSSVEFIHSVFISVIVRFVWWVILWVNLSGPYYPDIWSEITLDVSVKLFVFFGGGCEIII